MMKLKTTLAALIALSAFNLPLAYADHHEGTEDDHHTKADANNDGKVSYDEFKASREKHMEVHFKKADSNGDGFIDQDEKKAVKDKMKKRHERRKDRRDQRTN